MSFPRGILCISSFSITFLSSAPHGSSCQDSSVCLLVDMLTCSGLSQIYQLGWCQPLDHSNRKRHRRNFHGSPLVGEVSLWQPWALPSSKAWILFLLSGKTQMRWAKEHMQEMEEIVATGWKITEAEIKASEQELIYPFCNPIWDLQAGKDSKTSSSRTGQSRPLLCLTEVPRKVLPCQAKLPLTRSVVNRIFYICCHCLDKTLLSLPLTS